MGMRVYLSPPDIGEAEKAAVVAALESGWVAPLGPDVDGFEADIARMVGLPHAVALSSGTAALHLGLLSLGVGPGDRVVVPSLTFGATAFAVTYTGAEPVFIDSERDSWNLDPGLLADYLGVAARSGVLPAAVVPVDLFGRTADYDAILAVCGRYEVPVLVDSAESLGAQHGNYAAGSMGRAAVFSFNGNKIMTTSGGGMLVTGDADLAERARGLACQARQPGPWYEHTDIGFNYRMSNILAALGRVQLARLPEIVRRRREIRATYTSRLDGVGGIQVQGDPTWGQSNCWLTTILLDPDGVGPEMVIGALAQAGIEARHVWKPMHLQPVFAGAPTHGGSVAEDLFARGVCLPSGTRMTDAQVEEVAGTVAEAVSHWTRPRERLR